MKTRPHLFANNKTSDSQGSHSCVDLAMERGLVVRSARRLHAFGWLSVCTAFVQETDTLNSSGGIRNPTVQLVAVDFYPFGDFANGRMRGNIK